MAKLKEYRYTVKFEQGEAQGTMESTSKKKVREALSELYETGSTKKDAPNKPVPMLSVDIQEVENG